MAATACLLLACGKEPVVEEPEIEAADGVPEAVAEPVPPVAEFDKAFIDHMHVHADQMDELMFALDDGDLEAAAVPAAWLSRHGAEDRIPDHWLPYLAAMRESARAVETATDLETARAAAEQISVHCQECHRAAGVLNTD
jgi:hypothetical protein